MKVIFLDIDGTLVGYDMKIPESAIKAIQETRKRGNKVYLTTGRSKAEVYENLWEIGLDGMIGGNGMYIEDNGVVIQDLVMKKEDVIKAVDWMKEHDLGFYLESKNGLFGSDNLAEKSSLVMYGEDTEEHRKQIDAVFPHMIFGTDFYRDDIAKISFCLYPDLLDEAKEKFGDILKVSSWSGSGKKQEFGEFAILGIDKVHAVDTLLEYLKVGKEDTFAFGDAASDKQMVEYCEVGIAMGNAEEGLKEAADFVTDTVADDGLWNAFVRYNLV
ncbi:Cof-type HAD-IIB family hydrolase [Konateibacter massiliensis]|uniref:Cof-type HAD-IIB family hydrolase n=1 Tax=Konateibacter massiliensis TaxID=2002841 RepID=UPI000C146168|nr:Cof-type HAD-IIB family hydrolase [Konateibacter massiliensis]